jgi:hypothetical protein
VGPDGTPIVYDRVFIPGDRFRITRTLKYDTPGRVPARTPDRITDVITVTTTTTGHDASAGPIASRAAARMSACAKEPNRHSDVLHVQPL